MAERVPLGITVGSVFATAIVLIPSSCRDTTSASMSTPSPVVRKANYSTTFYRKKEKKKEKKTKQKQTNKQNKTKQKKKKKRKEKGNQSITIYLICWLFNVPATC